MLINTDKLILAQAYIDCDFVVSSKRGTWGCHGGFHGLRHTHATLFLEQFAHPKIASKRLGHKDVFITLNRYSHVLPWTQEDTVKIFSERLFG
ncbi:TPA: tyrosine-type recombinase/integrase [Bacillus wiedmannii]|nr:tyrosine-type recombinase/integrase [Bacillus wiedmannii]